MKTFNLNGQSFTEGDCLTIITPEFGTLPTTTTIQSYSHGSVVGLALTPLSNGPTCQANLSLYTNGNGYHTLQLAYVCSCAHNVHRRYYEWFDWQLEGYTVTTGQALQEKPLAPVYIPPRKEAPRPTVEEKLNAEQLVTAFLPTLQKTLELSPPTDEDYWRSRWHEWVNPTANDTHAEFERKRLLQQMWPECWLLIHPKVDRFKFKSDSNSIDKEAGLQIPFQNLPKKAATPPIREDVKTGRHGQIQLF